MERNSVLGARRGLRAVGAVLLAFGALLAVSGTAVADPAGPPDSGDPRAVLVVGNAVACDDIGLSGDDVKGELDFTIEDTDSVPSNTYIDVTAVKAGTKVTAIVVKGSDGYNVYRPDKLGPLPWLGLHSPTAGRSGGPAAISHWFACGTGTPPSSSRPKPSDSPSSGSVTPSEAGTSSAPSSVTASAAATTSGAAAAVATATTAPGTTAAAGTSAATENLAYTGFGGGWLIPVGVLLLAVGAGLLFWQRRTRSSGR